MAIHTYDSLLKEFGSTLHETSKCETGMMTSMETNVVNFDKLKVAYAKSLKLAEEPKSCDALYMGCSKELYLIEFKSGKIDTRLLYEVKIKVFESLLILLDRIKKTIDFTRKYATFILVCDEDRYFIHEHTHKRSNGEPKIIVLKKFEKLYFKSVMIVSVREFESIFAKVASI